ncbi:ABC transporter permease subunit [Cryptosporangium sp. NPDC051539]|uniref:ABC transporter permease subunit n=1 Tax=Cryptosporangium sp. NPDC051539 TaxID=3363962 RepID=UPI003795C91B
MKTLLHAEWTKFRTIRGWLVAALLGALLIVGFGVLPGQQGTCSARCALPRGPEGQEVTDRFEFVHRTLTGDGSITARITAFTGERPSEAGPPTAGLVPWAKAGLILKDGTKPGSSYAAVMLTGAHGVRFQHDYVHDGPGPAGNPRWLRLSRAGDTVTAAASTDGSTWHAVGSATVKNLPGTVEAGLFTTSPQYSQVSTQTFGTSGAFGGPSTATAVFDHVSLNGHTSDARWRTGEVGGVRDDPAGAPPADAPGDGSRAGSAGPEADAHQAGGVFTLTGSGDVAPAVSGVNGLGTSLTQTLIGTFVGLILLVALGALFLTAEYRRGLIATTFTATPARGRVLAAKALVLAAVAGVLGAAAAAAAVTLGRAVLRGNGVYVNPVPFVTESRLVLGTGLLLALCAVLALAVGSVIRKSAPALVVVLALTVLPYLLAMTVLPSGAAQWVLRVTPAAAFAVQQSAVQYAQVDNLYTPPNGYFPLPPGAGLAVLAAWTAAALVLAAYLLRRRDA